MRLTLRTLLAYIDGILETENAEEIGKKIEDSEFATNLLHRIRDVMQRLRLAAPRLADRGPGLDANTVAEYLDNTLHDDRVPDFEKVCLDSDVHLAEVASCHQILTLVLGEAAEIDPAARQRMYQLPNLLAAEDPSGNGSDAAEVAAGDGGSGDRASTPRKRRKPIVPDYLREPRKRRSVLPVAVALMTAACIGGVALGYFGYFERDGRLMCLLLGRPEEIADQTVPGSDHSASEQSPPDQGPPEEPANEFPAQPPEPPEEHQPVLVAPLPPESDNLPTPPTTPPNHDTPPEPPPELLPEPLPELPEPLPGLPPEPAPGGALEPTLDVNPDPNPDLTPEPDSPQPPGSPGPQRMGALMSDQQVLLRYHAESTSWQRVPPQGILISEEPLVAPTGFRPKIALSAGVTLQLLGSTRIELLAGGGHALAGVRIRYGRVLIMPLAEAGTQLQLVIGDRTGVITFADAESIVALEVTHTRIPGTDPERVPVAVGANLYARTGQILWDEGAESEIVPVEAGACLAVGSQPADGPRAVQELPKWLMLGPLGDLDRRATSKVEQSLQIGRSPGLVLMELADPNHRQEEVRRLAARCLGDMGRFDDMVAALNDSGNRLDWPKYYIEYLRNAVARSPDEAAEVRQAIERQYREEPAAWYRMLWDYSAEDLEGGQDAKLVEYLDHKVLAFRVLSFWNLKNITGYGLYYHPDQTAAKRQGPVRSWRIRLEAGEIKIKALSEETIPPVVEQEGSLDKNDEPPQGIPVPL